ncbi:kinase-like protein [Punctularia strigosozonata HHB-11173 SS5]|uniref:Kinase-like protein n=1 Tax=Punctularia strigosozonata (strain HHB-11173) TaxID=741275 RepID=R7S3P2_PUNST|nr:kinase-like protein [Punctularia strigosozonata HHB-11173 SS5]EIN04417.1 kinase-like protein [Punctularia strigosozonata HHB-11173 SS5]
MEEAARIRVNGRMIYVGDECPLLHNTVIRIGDHEYIYRFLGDLQDVPYHVDRYSIDDHNVLRGVHGKGFVFSATHLTTGHAVAVKVLSMPTKKMKHAQSQLLRMVEELTHQNILSFSDWFLYPKAAGEAVTRIGMVTSLLPHGNLFDYIKIRGKLGELLARPVVAQLMDGLMYMHSQGVLHRQVEPENILVCDESCGQILTIKISGFGSAQRFASTTDGDDQKLVGNAQWAPPELLKSKYNELGDTFGVGAIMFFVLWEKPFYRVDDEMSLKEQMQTRLSNYTAKRKLRMGSPACNLLDKLTKENTSERLRLREARCDPWLERRQVPPPFLKPYSADHYLVRGFIDRNGLPEPAFRRTFMTNGKSTYYSDSDNDSDNDSDAETDADVNTEQDDESGPETTSHETSISDASSYVATDARSDAGSESSSSLEEEEDRPELEWYSTNYASDLLFLPDNNPVWDPVPRSPKTTIYAIPVSDAPVGAASGVIDLESDGGDDDTDTLVGYDDHSYSMDLTTEEDEDQEPQVASRTSRASRSKRGRGGRVGGSRRVGIAASSDGRQRARTSARLQAAKVRATELKRTERVEARNVQKMVHTTEKKLARAAASAKSLLKNLAKLDAM